MRRMIATFEPPLISVTEQPLTIGERFRSNVRRLMSEQHLSQAGLAERLTTLGEPTRPDNLRALLGSPSYPSTRWVELMARALNVSESEILAIDFSIE